MIRIYCDSNVYRLLKPTSKQFNQTVFDHFENILRNAVIVFSEAHLDDLRTSEENFRDEDLALMEKYTGDFYIYYNQSSKAWDCFRATPKEAYSGRDYSANEQALNNPFDFRSLVADLGDFEGKEELCALMDNFMQTPISAFGLSGIQAADTDENKELQEKMIPGYDPNMEIGAFLQSMTPYMSKLLNDHQEFDELRRNIASFVDTNDYKYKKWGFAFNDQLEKTLIGKKFTDILRQLSSADEIKDYWKQFQHAYSLLEMLGITEERTGKKRKKNNLTDLMKDAAHAFNAMSCDYFITNDKGLLVKAQILYHIFQVDRPQIINLDELDQFGLAHTVDDSFHSLVTALVSIPYAFEDGKTAISFNLEDKFLHYFDLVWRFKENEKIFILSAGDDGRNFMYREILKVCNKVVQLWGNDGYGKGAVEIDELHTSESLTCLRVWDFNDAIVQLLCANAAMNFYIIITFK